MRNDRYGGYGGSGGDGRMEYVTLKPPLSWKGYLVKAVGFLDAGVGLALLIFGLLMVLGFQGLGELTGLEQVFGVILGIIALAMGVVSILIGALFLVLGIKILGDGKGSYMTSTALYVIGAVLSGVTYYEQGMLLLPLILSIVIVAIHVLGYGHFAEQKYGYPKPQYMNPYNRHSILGPSYKQRFPLQIRDRRRRQ